MGTSYIDTEITYRDYFLYSPLWSPLKILNLQKKVLNEEESRLKKIQEKKAIKNLRDPDADNAPAFLVEDSNSVLKPEPKAEKNSNGPKTFRKIPENISEETCQKMGKVWNEEVQKKLQGCWSEIRLTPERSQKLNLFLKEFLNNDFEAWRSYCQKISRYRFLMGESKRRPSKTKGSWMVSNLGRNIHSFFIFCFFTAFLGFLFFYPGIPDNVICSIDILSKTMQNTMWGYY